MKRRVERLRAAIRAEPAISLLWCAAVFLRVFLLNAKSLWLDESMTLVLARAPLADLLDLVRTNELLPPLHYALMHFWIKGFADQVLGLRVFSLLCGIGTLAVFRRVSLRLVPKHAALAFALAALSSYWIDLSQSGRAYSLFVLLATLQFDLFLRLRDRWKRRDGLAYAAVGALGLYTHYFFGFALLSQVLYAVWRHRRRPNELAPWLWTCAFWLVALGPWLPSVLTQMDIYGGKPTLSEAFGPSLFLRLFGGMYLNMSVLTFVVGDWVLYAGGGIVAFLVLSPFWEKKFEAHEKEALGLAASQALIPLVAVKAAELAFGRPMTQARYFVFLSVPLYLLTALLIGRLKRSSRLIAASLLSVVVAGGIIGYDYSCLELDSRLSVLAANLRRSARRGDLIVHLNPFYYTSLRYEYLPELPHFILDDSAPFLNWRALPGYAPVIPRDALARQPRVLIVDPDRVLFDRRLGESSGAQLAEWARAKKR